MDFKEENSDFLSKMRRFTHNLNTHWINIFISKILTFYPVNYLPKLKTLPRNRSRSYERKVDF